MATVIRDVVIRVGIQNGQSTLSMSGIQQATSAATQLQDQLTAAETASASLWQNLRGPTAAEAAAATETVTDAIKKMRDEQAESIKRAKEAQENTEKIKKAQTELTTAYLQVGEAAKQTMSGAMGLARSYAYLTAASEEDLRSAMQLIATVEGVSHSVSGTIDIVTGLVKTYRSLETAGKAAALANTLLAASQKGIGGAVGGAATSAVGAATAGAAGAGGFAAVKLALGSIATTGAKVAAAWSPTVIGIGIASTALATFGQRLTTGTSTLDEFLGLLEDRAKAAESEKKTADMQGRSVSRFDMAQAAEGRFGEQATMQAQLRAAQMSTASGIASVGAVTPQQQMEAINKQRAMARQELAAAQAEIAQAEQNAAQRRAAGQAPLMAEMTSALERQKTAAEQVQQIEERRLSALRSGQDLLRAQRDQQVAALQTAQQALQLEQDKNKSLAVRFAQLTEIEQAQLRSINEQIKSGGQLKEQDVAFLEQKGFGQKVTEDFRVKQANAAGFGNLSESLGGGGAEREKQLTDQVKARQKQIDQMTGQILESQGQIEQAEASLVTAINGQGEATIKALQAAHDAIQKQKERLDRMQQMSRN